MARRTRRRRSRVLWLPTFGIQAGEDPTQADPSGVWGQLAVPGDGSVIYDAFPLTYDYSQSAYNVTEGVDQQPYEVGLIDITSGNEWFLKRIVGKFFGGATSDEVDSPAAFHGLLDVALGFIVCKTDDDGNPTTNFATTNPLARSSMNDPWIWRRRWLMNPFTSGFIGGNPGGTVDTRDTYGFLSFPSTTAGFGSAVDGPHIDQKTARRIHREERLFGVVAACSFSNFTDTQAMQLDYLLDYRLLGTIAPRSAGNRGNTSR